MAEALYLVSKANADSPSETIINDIHCALVNADDASTDAEIIADAEGQIQTLYPIPDGYFDTVTAIGDLTSGPLPDDTDTMVILRRTLVTIEA